MRPLLTVLVCCFWPVDTTTEAAMIILKKRCCETGCPVTVGSFLFGLTMILFGHTRLHALIYSVNAQ